MVRPIHREGLRGAVRPTPVGPTPLSLFAEQHVALTGLACRPPKEVDVPITHWSASELRAAFAAREGVLVSESTIHRVLRRAVLKPHRQRYWLTSHDPHYDEKLRDIVRLYLEPPPGATILSIDEKPNIQALSRVNPDLPMKPGRPVAREFEYKRHGVMHLFAAFNVRTGHVDSEVYPKKTRYEFIELLERLAWRYRHGTVHYIVDNASYHSTPEVKDWLAKHPRFVPHYTPTHASWLNQVECWFSLVARKVVRRGNFNGKDELRRALLDYVDDWNGQAHPFNWTYGAELLHEQVVVAA